MNVAADMGIPYDSEEFAEENHYESDRSYDELSFVTHEDPIDLEEKFEDHVLDSTDVIYSPSFTKETWIGDTGASTTTTNDDSGMFHRTRKLGRVLGNIGTRPTHDHQFLPFFCRASLFP